MTSLKLVIIDDSKEDVIVKIINKDSAKWITVQLPKEYFAEDDTSFGLNLVTAGHYH